MTTGEPGRRVDRTARAVATGFALVALGLLGVAVALVLVPVRVPQIGDSSPYRCIPLTGSYTDPTADCASHVDGRLRGAAVAAIGAGVAGVLAFGIVRESTE